MSNVKETKEAVVGALKLGAFMYSKFKDGVQATDFVAIMAKFEGDEEFRAMIVAAYTDADKVSGEIKDIDFKGAIELGSAIIAVLPEVVDQINK